MRSLTAEVAKPSPPRWWLVRPAHNLKPATYRCPLCGEHLPALSTHMLIVPEGDSARRRHAHSACVLKARRAGRLPTREEWRRAQPAPEEVGGRWRRLRMRLRGRVSGR